MDVNSSRADLLPQMLEAVLSGGPRPADGDGGAGAIWRLRAAIPTGARGAIARALPDRVALELTARLELRGIDWSRTAAFCHPADNQGYIRLNLRGRERDGIVDPGDAGELLRTIAAGLTTFRDPDGAPAVASADRVAEHHAGARASQLPDLVVQWSERPATTLGGVHSPAFGRVLDVLPEDCDVIVASAVGMDVNSSRADLLPQMLEAVLRGGPLPAGGDGGAGAIWRLRAAIPTGARGAIAQALPDRVALS